MNLKTKAVVAALLLVGSFALAHNASAQAAVNPATDNAAVAPASQVDSTYVIGPEDILHVAVWKETDLTVTEPVRADGKISLPLLNDVQAAGLTPMQLADSLTDKLKKFVADPRVTVVVTAINSKKVYLIGEVGHTGAMSITPNMTVMQALSSAGINQFANTKKIYLLRTENGKKVKYAVPYKKLIKGQEIEHDYALQPGDTIVVP
ncbi:MAG TPA: polysaccharide biosynthesis/export family protein [Terriglobales bacterium]|nr:polysaccharide biosynthesis/export family protein [Terriglobales bacterium]